GVRESRGLTKFLRGEMEQSGPIHPNPEWSGLGAGAVVAALMNKVGIEAGSPGDDAAEAGIHGFRRIGVPRRQDALTDGALGKDKPVDKWPAVDGIPLDGQEVQNGGWRLNGHVLINERTTANAAGCNDRQLRVGLAGGRLELRNLQQTTRVLRRPHAPRE